MVIFASLRPLERAENIKAVWDAYDGEKIFARSNTKAGQEIIKNVEADCVITDEYISQSASPIIMIFHGIAGGKTYGLDQPRPYHYKENVENYLYFITGSEQMVDFVAKQCGAPKEKVLPLGMPRTDQYFQDLKRDPKFLPEDKRIYLYCPTFNTTTEKRTDWHKIDEMLDENEIFVIKNHMITGDPHISGDNHLKRVKIASCNFQSAPFLKGCDVLITDYSSIMFDGMLLDKPVVLYEKDYEVYKQTRGMYFNYPTGYSGRHVRTEWDLIGMLRNAKEPDDICMKNKEYLAGACDGYATERLVKLIKDIS